MVTAAAGATPEVSGPPGAGCEDAPAGSCADSAVAGRVSTLLVEAERHVPGHIDASSGEITLDDLASPEVDDLLDDIAELVLRNGGQVVIVPAERMPATGYRDGFLTSAPILLALGLVLLVGLYVPPPLEHLLREAVAFLEGQR